MNRGRGRGMAVRSAALRIPDRGWEAVEVSGEDALARRRAAGPCAHVITRTASQTALRLWACR